MTRRYFGTDGIRGRANSSPMTPEIAMRCGMAAGRAFTRSGGASNGRRVVIGKDTRLSGYMIESALVAGFTAVGMNVFQLGPMPTPAVALLTRSMRADLGVMISASHNPFEDNGIKLFGPDGYKLSDAVELEIERLIDRPTPELLAPADGIGRAARVESARERYIEFAKRTWPSSMTLHGIRIVLDCANGAAYKVAPLALWELGAEVFSIGAEPNGTNINHDCGSTSPGRLVDKVRELRADIGIALDGDGDRVIIVDEKGRIVDGDQLLAVIAEQVQKRGALTGGALVGTVMSNLGLERFVSGLGIELVRTRVGDRYVVEEMRRRGCNVGGEQSGHVVLSDYSTTGDGLVAALQVLAAVVQAGRKVSEVCRRFEPVPQVLESVRYSGGQPLENAEVETAIAAGTEKLKSNGRLVIRPSGTEPVIRIMAEGEDSKLVRAVVGDIVETLRRAAA
jgi:phosphoglucosamine mutase